MLTQDVINLLNYVLLVSAVQEADLAYRNPQRHAFETILRNLDRTSSRLLHPEVLGFVGEVLVTSLVEIFRSDVGQVVLSRNLVDADIFLLHEFTGVEKALRHVLRARTEGPVPDDVKCSRVVDVQRRSTELRSESQLCHHVGAECHLLHRQCRSNELGLHCLHGSEALKSRLEAHRRLCRHHDAR